MVLVVKGGHVPNLVTLERPGMIEGGLLIVVGACVKGVEHLGDDAAELSSGEEHIY